MHRTHISITFPSRLGSTDLEKAERKREKPKLAWKAMGKPLIFLS